MKRMLCPHILTVFFLLITCSLIIAQEDSITLWEAARNGDLDGVKTLIAKGVDINKSDDDRGNFALILAIVKDHTEVVKYLLENGADVNIQTSDGYTPLMYAIQRQNYEAVKTLIDSGANVDIQAQSHGNTALILAAQGYSRGIVRLLLEAGADPSLEDENQMTALMVATEPNYPDTSIAKLLSTGLPNFRLNIVQNQMTIPIDFTIDKNQETATLLVYDTEGSLLLNNKIAESLVPPTYVYRWNLKDQKNQGIPSGTYFFALKFADGSYTKASGTVIYASGDSTSLLIAAERRDLNLLKHLLTNGADIYVNVKDSKGRTPLMIAAKEGSIEIANELLSSGADVYEQDIHGNTALVYAVQGGYHQEMVKLVREAMVKRQITR